MDDSTPSHPHASIPADEFQRIARETPVDLEKFNWDAMWREVNSQVGITRPPGTRRRLAINMILHRHSNFGSGCQLLSSAPEYAAAQRHWERRFLYIIAAVHQSLRTECDRRIRELDRADKADFAATQRAASKKSRTHGALRHG